MRNVLAIESASQVLSVALKADSSVLSRTELPQVSHSALILTWIDELVKKADIALADLDCVAFGAGPGAFTGVRLACSVAQGLGLGLEVPVVAAPNLECQCAGLGLEGVVAAVSDARMNQCYAAVFSVSRQAIEPVSPESVLNPEELQDYLASHGVTAVTGNAFFTYELQTSAKTLPKAFDARDILTWMEKFPARVKPVAPERALPLYVRNHVALSIEERRKGERL